MYVHTLQFADPNRLIKLAKKAGITLSKKAADRYLLTHKPSYYLHVQKRRHFKRARMISYSPDQIWQMGKKC